MNKKIIVIYHRADFDGIFCREIARKFLGDTAEYIGWDYGDAVPQVDSEVQLYMLDISVEGLMLHPGLVWIDHHKSAIEKFSPNIPGYRIDGVAACRLTWQWFAEYKDESVWTMPIKQMFVDRLVSEPLAVRLAGEYDIWDKRDPRAELFQHGLRSQKLGDPLWEVLLSNPSPATEPGKQNLDEIAVEALLDAGNAIQYAQTQLNADIITAYGFTVQFEGLTFLACNHARFNSHLFTAGIRPEHDALLGFNFDGPKQGWRFSLYGIAGKDIDLSLIAVKYGGGGHRGACGFRAQELPFMAKVASEVLTCVYCGAQYPNGTPPHGSKILTDHIKVCEKHPMQKLRAGFMELMGVETTEEAVKMQKIIEAQPASENKFTALRAIKILLEN